TGRFPVIAHGILARANAGADASPVAEEAVVGADVGLARLRMARDHRHAGPDDLAVADLLDDRGNRVQTTRLELGAGVHFFVDGAALDNYRWDGMLQRLVPSLLRLAHALAAHADGQHFFGEPIDARYHRHVEALAIVAAHVV